MRSLALFLSIFSQTALTAEPDPKERDPIEESTKKGVQFLLNVHRPTATYTGGSNGIGTSCLGGMALLECGVDEKNPSMQNIIRFVRREIMKDSSTYNISLAIMFLDRLGDPADEALIQFLAVRLMSGQTESGGWAYDCGLALTRDQNAELRKVFEQESRLIRVGPPSKTPNDPPKKEPQKKDAPEPAKKESKPQLHPAIGKLLTEMKTMEGAGGDNSNTQFAILGLWCARKHGVPVDKAMKAIEKRFRENQCPDGGWDYGGTAAEASTPSMTCAGLIAMAVTYGTSVSVLRNKVDAKLPVPEKKDRVDLGADEAVTSGLKLLGKNLRGDGGSQKNPVLSKALTQDLYLMWSLERVGMIYGLSTIGKVDWYTGGAEALVKSQRQNGSWSAVYQPDVDTAFALLFLHRANVAKDLSATLEGQVKDPGIATLRSGDISSILGKNKNDPPKKATTEPPPKPKATNPEAEFEAKVSKLTQEVLGAAGQKQSELIRSLREAKGSVNTEALSRLIPNMKSETQNEVREALATRLTRMSALTLFEMLKDDRREIRLAAVTACGLKGDKQFTPDLINALEGKDGAIVQAAHASLHKLAGKDFGPAKDASDADKARSIEAWKNWWKMQK
jgi:hypothetical protein